MKQRPGLLRQGELLHQLAHDDGQLTADFFLQLRVVLVCRDDSQEVQNKPAARHAPAASAGRRDRAQG